MHSRQNKISTHNPRPVAAPESKESAPTMCKTIGWLINQNDLMCGKLVVWVTWRNLGSLAIAQTPSTAEWKNPKPSRKIFEGSGGLTKLAKRLRASLSVKHIYLVAPSQWSEPERKCLKGNIIYFSLYCSYISWSRKGTVNRSRPIDGVDVGIIWQKL